MAAEKKGGGFFNLFDWNRKSRKKLFAIGNGSPGCVLLRYFIDKSVYPHVGYYPNFLIPYLQMERSK